MIAGVIRTLAVLAASGAGTNVGKATVAMAAERDRLTEAKGNADAVAAELKEARRQLFSEGNALPPFELRRRIEQLSEQLATGGGPATLAEAYPPAARSALAAAAIGFLIAGALNRAATVLGRR